ncbi:MAG: diguanylate cyclase [Lachnospiraceae bacterium]|nr:diguanylate cyclase [Lachnospiraceae bacterium]
MGKNGVSFLKNIKAYYLIIAISSAMIFLIMSLFYIYAVNDVDKNVRNNSIEVTSAYGEGIEKILKGQCEILEIISNDLVGYNMSEDSLAKSALSKIKNLGVFNSISYVTLEGDVISVDNAIEQNVSDDPAFIAAKEGRTAISPRIYNVAGEVRSILICTPIRSVKGVTGVLAGYIHSDTVGDILNYSFSGEEDLILMDDQTTIIGISSNTTRKIKKSEYKYYLTKFEFEDNIKGDEIYENIKEGNNGVCSYTYTGENLILSYVPLNMNGWVLMRTIDKDKAYEGYNAILRGISMMFVFIIIVFLILSYILIMVVKRMIATDELNSKYTMIDTEKKSATFTYNPISRAIELNGAVSQIFGDSIASLGTVNSVTLIDMLHPDDQDIMKVLTKRSKSGDSKFTTEIRVKDQSGEYCWYKLSGIFVRNSRGETSKVVGNIQNSDEEIAQEHILKNKAESDLLTGLLNKITMEDSINRVITDKPSGSFYFYIIDLDNFKGVNDNLGHATGDTVLVEVAGKLSRIFSEFDLIGRIGGDEFAVFLIVPENMSNNASHLVEVKAKAICNTIRHTYTNGEVNVTVSASVGVARYDLDGKNYEELYKHADQALYLSKRNGKNQYHFYGENLSTQG